MKKAFRWLAWIFATYLLMCIGAALFLAKTTLHPSRRPLPEIEESAMEQEAARLDARLQDAEISTADSVRLRGWEIQPDQGNGDGVILLHGLGDNRLGTVGYAEMLVAHGYTVVMPDARAHGKSGGELATYGLLERNDIREWFEWLQRTSHPRCIFGLGESMGAAELLQSLDAEPNFCAVVAESSFSTFREIAYDRMGQPFNAGPWVGKTVLRPVVEIALAYSHWKYGVDLTQDSPQGAVARTRVPVLLIHGTADRNIPAYHSRLISLQNSRVVVWQVAGADHCGALAVAPEEFERRVLGWFGDHSRTADVVTQ